MNPNDSLRSRLLARHQAAEPSLDSIRHAALADLRPTDATDVPTSQLLRALFLPNRHLWTALAAVWAIMLGLHLAQRTPRPPALPPQQLIALSNIPRSNGGATTGWFANRQAQLHAFLR